MKEKSQIVILQAKNDDHLLDLWLSGLSENTQDAYRRDVAQFRTITHNKPLPTITLEDAHQYALWLHDHSLSDASIRRKLNAVKSLFTFALKVGYLHINVMPMIRIPKPTPRISGRLLKATECKQLINQDIGVKPRLFLKFLYVTGVRISEACNVKWSDFDTAPNGRWQVQIMGKGSKMRTLLIPDPFWAELQTIRGKNTGNVFGVSRRQAHDWVKLAAEKAGLNPKISAHWLRHGHAIAALQGGAPLQLVRDNLGHSSIATTNWYLESMPDDSSAFYLDI
jgi:integrase/recombinase XerD